MCAGDAMKDLAIRWLIKRDMPEVLEIAHSGYSPLWSEDDFMEQLRKSNCIGVVAELNHDVLGFMVYCLEKSRLVVINFAVHPAHRHKCCSVAASFVRWQLCEAATLSQNTSWNTGCRTYQ